jgi:hypothetical protein
MRRPRIPLAANSCAYSAADVDTKGLATPGGASMTSPTSSRTTSIWTGGETWPVARALTSATSPTLMPRKVTGAPLLRPRIEPGK